MWNFCKLLTTLGVNSLVSLLKELNFTNIEVMSVSRQIIWAIEYNVAIFTISITASNVLIYFIYRTNTLILNYNI
jgi:hypothetical protein